MLVDAFGRPFRSLRVSVTDRCNLSCSFCHNEGQGHAVAPPGAASDHELPPEEIVRIARAAVRLGVTGIKLTGGEPLVRSDLEDIVSGLARLGVEVSMTTNGLGLDRRAASVADAGLTRVNVSIDTLDAEAYAKTRGARLDSVLAGVDAAVAAGLTPVKLNAVVHAGTRQYVPGLVEHVKRHDGLELQLIQFMPEMARRPHQTADVPALHRWLEARSDDVVVRESHHRRRYRIGGAWVELVDPVNNPEFCGACDRLRLTADGRLKGCINVNAGAPSLKDLDAAGIEAAFRQVIATRRPFYGVVVPAT